MNHFGGFYWCSIIKCLYVYVSGIKDPHSLGYMWFFISHLCNLCQIKLKVHVLFPGCEVCRQIMLEGSMQSTLEVVANDWCWICCSFLTGECYVLAVWSHACWKGDVPFDPMKLACRVGFMTSPLYWKHTKHIWRRWYFLVEKIQITGYT